MIIRTRLMLRFALIAGLAAAMLSCNRELSDPQAIVDHAMKVAGSELVLNARIEFDFRGRHYVADRRGGIFSYERIFTDSTGTVHDFVTNGGYRREVNGAPASVPDTMAVKYTSSVNSVLYFALLPYGLNDPAVVKQYQGVEPVEGKPYYKVKVTFREEGGGEDFDDEFYYWFHKDRFTMDYFAYSFEEANEISFRFRKAINARQVNGIRFQDYINYKPASHSVPVDSAMAKFLKGELEVLSHIVSENVVVRESTIAP